MTIIDRMFARAEAAIERWEDRRAHLPVIDQNVRQPWTLYRASACHDAMTVVYQPRGGNASRSTWIVPGTEERRCGS